MGDGPLDNLSSTWNLQVYLLHQISGDFIWDETASYIFIQKVDTQNSAGENRWSEWHDPKISSAYEASGADTDSKTKLRSAYSCCSIFAVLTLWIIELMRISTMRCLCPLCIRGKDSWICWMTRLFQLKRFALNLGKNKKWKMLKIVWKETRRICIQGY